MSTSKGDSQALDLVRFADWAESLPEATFAIGADGAIEYANTSARALMRAAGQPEAERIQELVADAAPKLNRYLSMCSRNRFPVPGALKWKQAGSGPARMRCDGYVVRPDSNGNGPLLMLRCTRTEEGSARFLALNQKIEELAREVFERRRMEQLLAAQNEALKLIATSAPLGPTLGALARMVEEYCGFGASGSILLLEPDGRHLRHGAAPRLPVSYTSKIDGVEIGPSVGSCGTAAFRNEPVIVTDIATDPLWADYKDLALAHGLVSCWSTPIVSTEGKVLGTFAIYYGEPHTPTDTEWQVVTIVTRTASIGIERKIAEEERARQAEELARSNEQLAASNAELERYAYVASHDLKEPLRQVSSFVQLLEKRYRGKLDQDADDFIGYIVSGSARMVSLVDGLLDFSRAGREPFRSEPVHMESVLKKALANLSQAIAETGAAVTSDPLPDAQGDPAHLARVFQNLIGNALKFRGPQSPRVHVSAREDGQWAVYSVADNGIGIAPEYHAEIFGVFKRLRLSEAPGSGIGLSVCKKVVERHGGTIWVESQEEAGATFHFTLPRRA